MSGRERRLLLRERLTLAAACAGGVLGGGVVCGGVVLGVGGLVRSGGGGTSSDRDALFMLPCHLVSCPPPHRGLGMRTRA